MTNIARNGSRMVATAVPEPLGPLPRPKIRQNITETPDQPPPGGWYLVQDTSAGIGDAATGLEIEVIFSEETTKGWISEDTTSEGFPFGRSALDTMNTIFTGVNEQPVC